METKAIPASVIAGRMRARGVTQTDLARLAGMTQAHVSHALTGHHPVSRNQLRQLGLAVVKMGLDRDPEPDANEPAIPVPCPIRGRKL